MSHTSPSGHVSVSATVSAAALTMRAKELTDPLFKESPVFAMVKQKGQVAMNQGGDGMEWPVKYRRRSIRTGGSPLSNLFPEVNRILNAEIPWRVYQLGEGITKLTKYATKNDPNSHINAFDFMLKSVMEDFRVDLAMKVYEDGAASGSQEMYGLESLFNATAVAANARVGTPAGTYATITQTLGNYGGSWTAVSGEAWPTGFGSDQYCFWSPLQIDTTNTNWSNTTKTWASNWQEQVQWCLSMMTTLNGKKPNAILITPTMLLEAKNNLRQNQRFEITQNKDTIEAGVDAVTVEGIEFIEDARIVKVTEADAAYAVTWDNLEIGCMGSEIIESDQDLDLTTKNWRVALDSHIQMKCKSPRAFAKFHAIS